MNNQTTMDTTGLPPSGPGGGFSHHIQRMNGPISVSKPEIDPAFLQELQNTALNDQPLESPEPNKFVFQKVKIKKRKKDVGCQAVAYTLNKGIATYNIT